MSALVGFDEKLEQESLSKQVLEALRMGLITGDLVPGTLYSASAIASQFGISTSPVREAMLSLVHQGVMEAVKNRGFRVIPLTENDRRCIHEMRLLLEVPSMMRLAGSAAFIEREGEFRILADAIVSAARARDFAAYLASDLRFHLELLKLLGNDRLVEQVALLRDQTRQVNLTVLDRDESLVDTAQKHYDILDALLSGDDHQVESVMLDHLQYIQSDWGPTDQPAVLDAAPVKQASARTRAEIDHVDLSASDIELARG